MANIQTSHLVERCSGPFGGGLAEDYNLDVQQRQWVSKQQKLGKEVKEIYELSGTTICRGWMERVMGINRCFIIHTQYAQ